MKTSFKKAMKGFLKSVSGVSYLTHKEYLTGGFFRGVYVLIIVLIPIHEADDAYSVQSTWSCDSIS